MAKASIFQITAVRATINDIQLNELVNFLVKYRTVLSVTDTKTMLSTRSLLDTPIHRVYDKLLTPQLNKDKLFAFIKVPSDITPPEMITYTHVGYDLKQLSPLADGDKLMRTISLVPEYSNRIVFNITSLVKKNNELNNSTLFQASFVRDMLSRSFFMANDVWVSPSTLQYLCKTYSMSVAGAISGTYDLTIPEQQAVATIFSLYFLQQITTVSLAEIILKNSARSLRVTSAEIDDVIGRMKETLKERYGSMTLEDACVCVRNLGIARLADIGRRFLFTRLKSLGPDSNTSAIALEYPPYWLYLILLAGSGQKIGLLHSLKNWGLAKDITTITEDLLRSQSLFNLMI